MLRIIKVYGASLHGWISATPDHGSLRILIPALVIGSARWLRMCLTFWWEIKCNQSLIHESLELLLDYIIVDNISRQIKIHQNFNVSKNRTWWRIFNFSNHSEIFCICFQGKRSWSKKLVMVVNLAGLQDESTQSTHQWRNPRKVLKRFWSS